MEFLIVKSVFICYYLEWQDADIVEAMNGFNRRIPLPFGDAQIATTGENSSEVLKFSLKVGTFKL